MTQKLVVAGSSGFLAGSIIPWFERIGWDVVTLTRQSGSWNRPGRRVPWDGVTAGAWTSAKI